VTTAVVERFTPDDLVAMAQCMAIDADAFPYASAQFGMTAATARVFVARDEGRVVGFLAARVRGRSMHVEGLAVETVARRGGVGRALVRAAAEDGADLGLELVVLHVSVTNRAAIRLYERERFTVVRRRPGFYPPAAFGGTGDALEMARRLRP
jgi:ribosomal protein S18 acetylase RimI-like enzyme